MTTTEFLNKNETHNLVCHFCGLPRPPYSTVQRGHFRLCRECLIKHQIDIVILGCLDNEEPLDRI
jgi:hypothetical protein